MAYVAQNKNQALPTVSGPNCASNQALKLFRRQDYTHLIKTKDANANVATSDRTQKSDAVADFGWSTFFLGSQYSLQISLARSSAQHIENHADCSDRIAKIVIYVAMTFIALSSIVGIAVFAYLLKSAAGIDLFSGASPLHFVYEFVFR